MKTSVDAFSLSEKQKIGGRHVIALRKDPGKASMKSDCRVIAITSTQRDFDYHSFYQTACDLCCIKYGQKESETMISCWRHSVFLAVKKETIVHKAWTECAEFQDWIKSNGTFCIFMHAHWLSYASLPLKPRKSFSSSCLYTAALSGCL